MAKNVSDSKTCNIDMEEPQEDDSFLEGNLQVGMKPQIDGYEVPYPYEYPPVYAPSYPSPTTTTTTNQPAIAQETWGDKERQAGPSHVVLYRSQGPLLPQEMQHQQQFYPYVQYIVRPETHPMRGGYLDMTSAQQVTQPAPKVPDYFCCSLLVCLFCAWPCGICAMIAARQAKSYAKNGDYVKAKSSARCSLYLITASVVFGLLSIGLTIAKILHKI